MDADSLLEQFTISNPCPMNWDDMDGDACSRYCTVCGKHVHDLTAVTAKQAAGLLREHVGHLCARVCERDGGTLLPRTPQLVGQPRSRPIQFTIRAIMGVIAGVAATLGIARLFADRASPPAPLPANGRMILGEIDLVPILSDEAPVNLPANKNENSAPPATSANSDGAS